MNSHLEFPKPRKMGIRFLFRTITPLFLCFGLLSASFTPRDNYLLNCGSNSNATVDNRKFIGDSTNTKLFSLSNSKSISVANSKSPSNSPSIYSTARVFTTPSIYSFNLRGNGTHLVRFHFSPFNSQDFNLSSAVFGVSVNGHSVFHGFTTSRLLLREFILRIDNYKLQLTFEPEKVPGFAFVNAIEVFSAPNDFVLDYGAKLVSMNGVQQYDNLSSRVLETVHRINVGGSKITPFNDTLWRTWIPDDDFLVLESAAKTVRTTHAPNYQPGGATREIAPDYVSMTAKEMNRNNLTSFMDFNISWEFPVLDPDQYLVRLHFCDIVSIALYQLYFNVYINGMVAFKDLDLSSLTFHALASPYYADLIVNMKKSGVVRVSVGPSSLSSSARENAILNGAEIMKILNGKITSAGSKKKKLWLVVGLVTGCVVVLGLAILAACLVLRCKKKKNRLKRAESAGWTHLRARGSSSPSKMTERVLSTSRGINGSAGLRIPFFEIQHATNNFDKSLVIGSGGFGMVYKGVLRDNTKVAVKRGVPGSRQGLPEFHTEISILSKIRHCHLVSLVGYCDEQSEMILVYEYVEKGPLKKHLYGSGITSPLSWKQRLEICIGAARGLHYLHTGFSQGIIHRDIKSTNILLDENCVAKVADFGLSRSGPCLDETHVSTGVKGSFGYLDPEYFRRQQLTDKSDVYSFGVVMLEVLCARPAVDPLLAREQVNLAEWALEYVKRGMIEEIVDPHIQGLIKPSSLKKFGDTANKCLAEYGMDRPTMGDVLWNLEYALSLQEGETRRENNGDDTTNPPELPNVPHAFSVGRDYSDERLEISTTEVFSQLMTNRGR